MSNSLLVFLSISLAHTHSHLVFHFLSPYNCPWVLLCFVPSPTSLLFLLISPIPLALSLYPLILTWPLPVASLPLLSLPLPCFHPFLIPISPSLASSFACLSFPTCLLYPLDSYLCPILSLNIYPLGFSSCLALTVFHPVCFILCHVSSLLVLCFVSIRASYLCLDSSSCLFYLVLPDVYPGVSVLYFRLFHIYATLHTALSSPVAFVHLLLLSCLCCNICCTLHPLLESSSLPPACVPDLDLHRCWGWSTGDAGRRVWVSRCQWEGGHWHRSSGPGILLLAHSSLGVPAPSSSLMLPSTP